MPRYVNIPGIGEYEFPDGMSDADIYSAVDGIIVKKRETTDYLDLLPDYTSAPPVEPVVPLASLTSLKSQSIVYSYFLAIALIKRSNV